MRPTSREYPTFVTHLECSLTGERYEAGQVHGLSKAGRPLLVRYDLDALRRQLRKEDLAARAQGDDFDAAFAGAYNGLNQLDYAGITYRRDIGHQVRSGG